MPIVGIAAPTKTEADYFDPNDMFAAFHEIAAEFRNAPYFIAPSGVGLLPQNSDIIVSMTSQYDNLPTFAPNPIPSIHHGMENSHLAVAQRILSALDLKFDDVSAPDYVQGHTHFLEGF